MFYSPTHGELTLEGVQEKIKAYIAADPDRAYDVIIGSDSQPHNGKGVDFVTAIVVHRKGSGGIYFWRRLVKKKSYVLRQRMYEEAGLSLVVAQELLAIFRANGVEELHIEIHVDIGSRGQTREMITEIVGMIRGSGYAVKIKPESYAASKVADRYT